MMCANAWAQTMIYGYKCRACGSEFDVIKAAALFERAEHCDCGGEAERLFTPNPNAILRRSGIIESPEFNPGLGCVVRSAKHRAEVAKRKGVEEIGNEPPESLHKYYDTRRAEKLESAYDEATKGQWVGNGE